MFEGIKNRRILVTGASSGIGAAIAELFSQYGALVGLHWRSNRNGVLKVMEEVKRNSGKGELFQGDLLDQKARLGLIPAFVKKFGGIDVLINNAGAGYEYKHFSELTEEEWQRMFDLHAKAPFFVARDAFPYMEKQKWGRIINISTVAIEHAGVYSMHYWGSKAALDALTRGFAREGAGHNILVNSIRCGVIDTPMRTKMSGYDEERFKKRVGMIPLRRAGKPLDIARLALFLASECGDYITGEIFRVAGGDNL